MPRFWSHVGVSLESGKAIRFNTHRFVNRLTEGGFTEGQAEVHLATRTDVAEIKAGTEALRHETRAEFAKFKTVLLTWQFGVIGQLP